jgi:hypothetical protein
MKHLSLLLLVVAFPLFVGAQGVIHLNPGQSFSYAFSSLDFIQSGALLQQGGGVSFSRVQLPGPTDQVMIELFENNLIEAPVASQILTGNVGDLLSSYGVWQDLQGVVRITALNAPLDLTGLQFSVGTGPSDFNFYQSFVPVPEPGSLSLFLVGCMMLGWGVRRRANKIK